jgi:VWFA-related protein
MLSAISASFPASFRKKLRSISRCGFCYSAPRLMLRYVAIACFCYSLFFLAPSLELFGQDTDSPQLIPRTKDERERRYQFERNIVLNVFVTDEKGKPISGLKPEEFTVLDDDHPQGVSTFQALTTAEGNSHAHILLVLDAINSSRQTLESIRKGIVRYLSEGYGPLPYPVSIILVNTAGNRELAQTTDRDVLVRGLDELRSHFHRDECASSDAGPEIAVHAAILGSPGTRVVKSSVADSECLNQRFRQSVGVLMRLAQQQVEAPGHAIVIWTGPGWPLLVGPEFLPDPPLIRLRDFEYLVELCRMLRKAQLTLNALLTFDPDRAAEVRHVGRDVLFNGTPSANLASAASLGLPAIARQSGGRVMENTRDIAAGLASSVADADACYMVSFSSAPASNTDEFHRLEVRVARPGVKVRTATSYYDQP